MTQVLKSLLLDSKDGEWGKGEASADSIAMRAIRGTDFDSVRIGSVASVPLRYIPERIAVRKTLRPLDIVFETAGGSKGRPTGRSVLLKERLFRKSDSLITCASFARFLRIDPEKADPEYVFWLLQHMYNAGILRQYHTQHTGVARYQYTTFAENELLALPGRSAQRRIASILSAYDDLIENNTRRIAILEEMARRIYEEWFVRFRFPGHENVRLVESELGLVPEEWSLTAIEGVTETLGGGTPSKAEPVYWIDGEINWYAPTDLTGAKTVFMEGSANKITKLGLAKSSAKLFPSNSVMMTSRATLGVIAVNTTAACTNQGFIVCIPSTRMPMWLLFHWLKANGDVFENLATGATFKEITKGVFRQIKLVVPPSATAAAFERVIGPMMDLVLSP